MMIPCRYYGLSSIGIGENMPKGNEKDVPIRIPILG
jgi:hypothetical protein